MRLIFEGTAGARMCVCCVHACVCACVFKHMLFYVVINLFLVINVICLNTFLCIDLTLNYHV